MTGIPDNPSESFKRRNPHLYPPNLRQNRSETHQNVSDHTKIPTRASKRLKPLLNKLETRHRDILVGMGIKVLEQAITLRLDPPYRSYTPDLAYVGDDGLTLLEIKGPHRFREKGIAKAALAAKTYPMFDFILVEWTKDKRWKLTGLSTRR